MIRFDGSSWEFAGSGNFFFFFLQPRVVAGATQKRRSLELPPMLYPSHGIFYLMNRPAMFRSDRGQERGEANKLKGSSLFEKEEVR